MRTNEKAGRGERAGSEQESPLLLCQPAYPAPRFIFLTAFLGICQRVLGELRGGKELIFWGRGEGSTKQMTFKLDLRGKAEELSRLGKQHVQRQETDHQQGFRKLATRG